MENRFKLVSKFAPYGDQPEAIRRLTENVLAGVPEQTLLGATGTGKTFTIANVIANVNKPTLVLAHNKTLAGQLYAEFKALFPENMVEFLTMIIINQKLMFHLKICISKKILVLMMK